MTFSRSLATFGVCVRTTMSAATGVVHEAGVPRRPSISTRQSRQDPNASSLSVAHSLGMSTPASAAARMTDVPSGTVTGSPSTSSEMVAGPSLAGVPKSGSESNVMVYLPSSHLRAGQRSHLKNG
jgi:hypothetical protein